MISLKLRIIREHNRIYKAWMRLLWRLHGLQAPITLMVHGFKPTREDCRSAFEMTCASFERLLNYLQTEHRTFELTFDDVYDTVYTEAYPVLKRMQIPFTLFITKSLIDKPTYITSEHLRELAKDPLCSIGCHGIDHVVFRNLTDAEMTRQCTEEKQWLEDEFGVKVTRFAYPYGRVIEVSCKNRRLLPQLGFEKGYSAIEGTSKAAWWTGPFYLPRVNVSETFVEKYCSNRFPRWKDCEGR